MTVKLVVIIFIVTYLFLMTEKWNRILAAFGGGISMLVIGAYSIDQALFQYIDWKTITLLFAMMLIVTMTSKTGFFEYSAIKLAQMVKGNGVAILLLFTFLAAVGSAFLANVTIAMLLVPILFTLIRILELPPIPYLISMILACNIGGTATLIGDPPNMMIGQAVEHFTFNAFIVNLMPVAALVLGISMLLLTLLYYRQLTVSEEKVEELSKLNPKDYLKKENGLVVSLSVLLLVLIGFSLQSYLHLDVTTVAIAGAVLLMALLEKRYSPDEILREVEWGTLFFLWAYFYWLEVLRKGSLMRWLEKSMLTEGDMKSTAFVILWGTGILSAVVDNIPFVAAMIPVITEFQEFGMVNMDPLWWSLALGACLGGNGTLLGSSSNLVIVGLALKERVEIKFTSYLAVGIPITLISLSVSTLYVYFKFLKPFL
ncbi:ArsB/NhaD family transporter [Bacillus coahuilensis]|uniref:ArsB/NhaD family transporter n=1 Tax=Bacillus coahuilensis TaxID=408580 RepID=UPI0009EC8BEB|nr:ArsB/NhaD family transporter [Bacillus coahuilensis]